MMADTLAKWRFYRAKYGPVHAGLSFVGRRWQSIWNLFGASVSRPYLNQWLKDRPRDRILNLGGGANVREEWLTGDIDPRADVYMNALRRLPLPDASMDAVFLEEVIEHVTFEQGRALLLECCRVMKPGGSVRISTPSLKWFCSQQGLPVPEGILSESALKMLGSAGSDSGAASLPAAAFNSVFYQHGHRFIYDEVSLGDQMAQSGFEQIRFGQYQDGSPLSKFDSHAQRFNHPPEMSLYAEGKKSQ